MTTATLSRRARREIAARESLSISVRPLSNGEWHAILVEEAMPQDRELYVSAAQPTAAEALTLALYELDLRVEKIVDQIEHEEELGRDCPTCGGSGGGPEIFRCQSCGGSGLRRRARAEADV